MIKGYSILTGAPITEKDLVIKRYFNGYDYPFHLYRCPESGVLQTIPLPNAEDIINNEYTDEYMAYHNEDLKRNLITARRRLKRILKYCPDKVSISLLDIGCSTGWFLKAAKDIGIEVFGIELSRYAAEKAKKLIGDDVVHINRLEDTSFTSDSFDIVHSNQVLEHVHNPAGFLEEQRRILKKNGLLVIGTPNSDSISYKLLKGNWTSLQKPDHIFIFNKKSLRYLLNRFGFDILRIYYAGMPPFKIKRKMIVDINVNRINSIKYKTISNKKSIKHKILGNYYFSNILSEVINLFRLGDTIYIVAKKRS